MVSKEIAHSYVYLLVIYSSSTYYCLFRYNAKKFAKQARKIARCRNETLLIYFATDDIHNLRPEAKRKLSSYGKVVFGLLESEVGHVSPMWRSVDNEEILQRANELKGRGIKRSDMIGTKKTILLSIYLFALIYSLSIIASLGSDTTKINVDVNMEGDTDLVMKYDQSAEATEKHGIMSLVEWWILGNSQWLVSHSGTSYSDTSAGWGFSPHGKMERLDIIHSKDHYSTSFRRNWESDTCAHMGAADPEQSQSCPNIRK